MAIFVVQHHLATSDHYDFRLEIDGALVSWAVPRGPSTEPGKHRLAMRTPDHAMAHADYVGETVSMWDRGTFGNASHDERNQPVDAAAGLARGHLTFRLDGTTLRGGYSLIRTRPQRGREAWLLTRKREPGS